MNFNQQRARYAGIALVILGVVAVFNLWWLVPAALLATGGLVIYRRQWAIGRRGEAVQALLWGVGLAVLLLADFIFPGVLILGGASLLLRGHEAAADDRLQAVVARFRRRRTPAVNAPTNAPLTRLPVEEAAERPATNETVRL
ncbi:MAG: hypothetical protein HXY37_18125 [Chloroflexi bacterium]|nr:hypothetical protein [Chloroflexota bacterium]